MQIHLSADMFFFISDIFFRFFLFFSYKQYLWQHFALRELTLFTFEYFEDTNARQDRTHTHKKAKE